MLIGRPKGVVSLILSGPALSISRWIADQRAYVAELPKDTRHTIEEKEIRGDFSSPEYQEAMMVYYMLHVCRLDPWPVSLNRTFQKLGVKVYTYMWGPSEFTANGTLRDYECADRLKEITLPVLCTCGRYDEATPASTEYYQSMLPGSKIAIFENSSHEHHIEKPEEYLETVRDFLHWTERR